MKQKVQPPDVIARRPIVRLRGKGGLRIDKPGTGNPPSARGESGKPSIAVVRPPEQPNGLPRVGSPEKGYSGLDHPPKGTHTAPISRLASVSAHPEIAQHLGRPV